MNIFRRSTSKLANQNENSQHAQFRYRRLWAYSVMITSVVSLAPLVVMTVVNYHQYADVMKTEVNYPISQSLSSTKTSLEFLIEERLSALSLIINEKSFAELSDKNKLIHVLSSLKQSFEGFIDLGLIDSDGNQHSYVGPYKLTGKNYSDQEWFHEVRLRKFHVSDIFMGFRNFPHFVIACKREMDNGDFYVLRATLDTKVLHRSILSMKDKPARDVFIINRQGIMQTSSRSHGDIMEQFSMEAPPPTDGTEILELSDVRDGFDILGYAYIDRSPFILILLTRSDDLMANWLVLRKKLLWFLAISVILIIIVVLSSSTYLTKRILRADLRQAEVLHNVQYTSKMASIGRLAAGVAHEINNPLAIINEKAGLLKDLANFSDEFMHKEKTLAIVNSIIRSVERCSTITHRLLGFAKRMDLNVETIHIGLLIKEVLNFLEMEANYRNIEVSIHETDDLPSLESDRGQLQQVFLNIINNAFAAVDDGGAIEITLEQRVKDTVSVIISDNGKGISTEDMKKIFEPFFTTKKEYGTGLGLSITYGIVQKLGGQLEVASELGEGTSFMVTLPLIAP
jgi:two-component system, NtrC family, sensor kinase